jgi:drug/metabolite transporter (DMT)-like permease
MRVPDQSREPMLARAMPADAVPGSTIPEDSEAEVLLRAGVWVWCQVIGQRKDRHGRWCIGLRWYASPSVGGREGWFVLDRRYIRRQLRGTVLIDRVPGRVDRPQRQRHPLLTLWPPAASAFVRSAGHDFSPGALALGRLLPAAVVLALISLSQRAASPPRAAWPGIAATGVLWFGVYMVALNWGEQHVDAGTAAMVVNAGPILIVLLSAWLLGEGLPRPLVAGITVSFGGVILVGVATSAGRHPSLAGVLLCLLAAAAYSLAVVAQKPALRHASALQVTTFGCAVGALACLPFSGQLVSQLATAPLTATLSVAYLGVFPTAVAFTTWAYALSALTVLMSWAILGQVPSWLALVGGTLCLVGVALSRRRLGSSTEGRRH